MKVTYEQIEGIAADLKKYSEQMKEVLNEITTEMNKVGNDGVWSGEAAESVKEQFENLSKKFSNFYDTVTNCSEHLNIVVANYKSVDATIHGQIN